MKRIRLFSSFVLILPLVSWYAILPTVGGRVEKTASFSQKVKTTESYYVFDEYKTLRPYTFDIIDVKFTQQSPAPRISPLSSDPGVTTANPFVLNPCPVDRGLPVPVAEFSANFKSLKDLGVWRVKLNGTWANPAYCHLANFPPCNIYCDVSGVSNWSEPFTFIITVFNDPPKWSISHSPTPAWNQTVTLNAGANDPDGGPLVYLWDIYQRPPGSTAVLTDRTTATPTIRFSNEKDIGEWRFKLDIDDDEGERRFVTHNLIVPNVPPNISINGATSIDVLETINLQVTPTTDVDGGTLDIVWDILESPPGASHGPQSGFTTGATLTIPTAEVDIGDWKFRATAKDNENASDSEEVIVKVRNLPPEINFVGESEIDIGQAIHVETTIVDDADGGDLTFQWDIVQAPQSSAILVQEAFAGGTGVAGAIIDIPTSFNDAGTWILRLKATDNDNSSNSEVIDDFVVVVDAPSEAKITGPAKIGALSFPLELSGDTSVDPDSPCPTQPDRCHDTLEPPVKSISPGIVSYTWSLIDVPFELWEKYPLGAIDEVFGVSAHASTMRLDSGDIEPGEWTFQLQVVDGEGNEAFTSFTVTVVDENGGPIQIVRELARH